MRTWTAHVCQVVMCLPGYNRMYFQNLDHRRQKEGLFLDGKWFRWANGNRICHYIIKYWLIAYVHTQCVHAHGSLMDLSLKLNLFYIVSLKIFLASSTNVVLSYLKICHVQVHWPDSKTFLYSLCLFSYLKEKC